MKAEVCLKCFEYILLKETFEGKQRIERFHKAHLNHPLVIVNEEEVKNKYQNHSQKYDQLPVIA